MNLFTMLGNFVELLISSVRPMTAEESNDMDTLHRSSIRNDVDDHIL